MICNINYIKHYSIETVPSCHSECNDIFFFSNIPYMILKKSGIAIPPFVLAFLLLSQVNALLNKLSVLDIVKSLLERDQGSRVAETTGVLFSERNFWKDSAVCSPNFWSFLSQCLLQTSWNVQGEFVIHSFHQWYILKNYCSSSSLDQISQCTTEHTTTEWKTLTGSSLLNHTQASCSCYMILTQGWTHSPRTSWPAFACSYNTYC